VKKSIKFQIASSFVIGSITYCEPTLWTKYFDSSRISTRSSLEPNIYSARI